MKVIEKYLIRSGLLLVIALMLAPFGYCRNLPLDNGPVTVRQIPDSVLRQYRLDKDFDYSEQKAAGMSLWDRFWYWIGEHIFKVSNSPFWSTFFKFILWGLCIYALVYCIIRFSGMTGIGLFKGHTQLEDQTYEVGTEDIYNIDFAPALQQAIDQNNFRLAIRLYYLQSLRSLADRDLIGWKPNKTNRMYVEELAGTAYRTGFSDLTRLYDFAWYGDLPVSESQFASAQELFIHFQQSLAA